jgi:hypothetical protein
MMSDPVLSTVLAAAIGGVLAVAGALAAKWIQLRTAQRTRMNQVIAERKVSANAEAYKFMKVIEGHLAEHTDEQALTLMLSREDWLFENRLFLPSAFYATWLSLRTTLRWLSETPMSRDSDSLRRLRLQAMHFVKESLREIQRDMKFENGGPNIHAPA